MWRMYGYFLASCSPPGGLEGGGRLHAYAGISRKEIWPVVDELYWRKPEALPRGIRNVYREIVQDPTDFLFLRPTRSSKVLSEISAFVRAAGVSTADALAIELDSDVTLPHCDELEVEWLGYEPYARGEWGLLSLLGASTALVGWQREINEHGLLSTPESCLAFSANYVDAMGCAGGPEPIAEDATIDILRLGLTLGY